MGGEVENAGGCMDGFLDVSNRGCTELRIHGVSGTPPEAILDHPHPRQVAGDGLSGFYRRWWPGGHPTGDDADVEDRRRREAYSWGGLTSGNASRALWLLLLPFMLVNFAFWMTPRPARPDAGDPRRKASAGCQRLLALSLTGSLVLSAVGVAMDLLGWQCGRPGAGCVARHGWLSFLTWSWLLPAHRQLAVTSLLPAAVVGLLWFLGRSTWLSHEQTPVPSRQPPGAGPEEPESAGAGPVLLEDRSTWNGGIPVVRLRAGHVAAAFSVVGVLLLAPLARHSFLAKGLLAIHLAAIAAVAVVVAWPSDFAKRPRPSERADEGPWWRAELVPLLSAALYALTVLVAFFGDLDAGRPRAGGLPWFTAAVIWTLLLQAGLLLVLLALTWVIGSSTRRREGDPEQWVPVRAGGTGLPGGWGLAGLGTPVVAMLGWLVAGGFGAGLELRAAGFLGSPVAAPSQPGRPSGALVVPPPYFWAAGVAMVVLLVTVLAVLYVVVALRSLRPQAAQQLDAWLHGRPAGPGGTGQAIGNGGRAQPGALSWSRRRNITATWARARVTDLAGPVVGSILVVAAVLVIASAIAYGVLGGEWLAAHVNWLTTAGSFAVGLLTLWLIGVGRSAYRNPNLRRTVGILWDVGTFWPRAVHPLAPPCYTERVMPALIERVQWLAPRANDVVVVSAHSQGTIIAAALVLQLDPDQRQRVRLLTYGSPLQRVYARYFPAYFGPAALHRVGTVVRALKVAEADAQPRPASTGATWGWRNLFRPSDPIGGAIFYRYELSIDDNGDIDWQLMDPAAELAAGDCAWPRAYGHSDYFRDPAFTTARQLLEES
jgi:hypothetical protein